jgi:hypothetical protein
MTYPRSSSLWRALGAGGCAVSLSLVLVVPALAQGAIPSQSVAGTSRRAAVLPQREAAPPALPGARPGEAAPGQRAPTDMPPTEAMFDGVNRGDIETVRDALVRGADLNAHNILGLTATEVAIDLGRNDIAFLLLSMRGAERSRNLRGGGQGSIAAPPAATPPPASRSAAPTRVVSTQPSPPVQTFPNDPGTAVPSAGFLGFGGTRGR